MLSPWLCDRQNRNGHSRRSVSAIEPSSKGKRVRTAILMEIAAARKKSRGLFRERGYGIGAAMISFEENGPGAQLRVRPIISCVRNRLSRRSSHLQQA